MALEQPSLSFSQCMGPSFRQTVAQIFGDERMSESTMLASHRAATVSRGRAWGGDYLIAAQDTTFYTYSGQGAMAGLGTVQGQVRGVLQPNVLLMSETGQPLGLLDQQSWTRQGGKDLPEGESESQKWLNGLGQVNAQVAELPQTVVVVADREADVFTYLQAERAANVALLVRVHQPRTLTVGTSGVSRSLPEVAPHLADVGMTVVRMERQHREVDLTLRLQAGTVTVHAPTAGPKQPPLEGVSLVVATEVACVDAKTQADRFAPDNPVLWLLLTSLPIETPEAVVRILRIYALRWRIERFHYTLKSGALKVESCQFDDIHTLVNALAFYSVVAWQLLALTYALRDDPDQPAETCFTPQEITLLKQATTRSIASIDDAVRALGCLVGFAPSKRQPWPGVKVLAMAIERFHFIKLGAMASSKPLQD